MPLSLTESPEASAHAKPEGKLDLRTAPVGRSPVRGRSITRDRKPVLQASQALAATFSLNRGGERAISERSLCALPAW